MRRNSIRRSTATKPAVAARPLFAARPCPVKDCVNRLVEGDYLICATHHQKLTPKMKSDILGSRYTTADVRGRILLTVLNHLDTAEGQTPLFDEERGLD